MSCLRAGTSAPSYREVSDSEKEAYIQYKAKVQSEAGDDPVIDAYEPPDGFQLPVRVKYRSPDYPPSQHGRRGRVVLAAVIERDGTVGRIAVLGHAVHPAFDKRAIEAVRRWRYDPPGRLDGDAVRTFMYTVITFETR